MQGGKNNHCQRSRQSQEVAFEKRNLASNEFDLQMPMNKTVMNRTTLALALYALVGASGSVAAASPTVENRHPRDNLYHLQFSDGTVLAMRACVRSLDHMEACKVRLGVYRRQDHKPLWEKEITSVNYMPADRGRYYAVIANWRPSIILVYFAWNGMSCLIDRINGRTYSIGEGDQDLSQYDSVMLLKLRVCPTDTFRRMTEDELKQSESDRAKNEWELDMVARFQDVPGSKFENHYIVVFDNRYLATFDDERHPNSRLKRPLFIIVWKCQKDQSSVIELDYRQKTIVVDEHPIRPPSNGKAIYALQPDYSLKKLPITEQELARLFCHITRSEEREVSSWERDGLPFDSYWEKQVGPYLEIVPSTRTTNHPLDCSADGKREVKGGDSRAIAP